MYELNHADLDRWITGNYGEDQYTGNSTGGFDADDDDVTFVARCPSCYANIDMRGDWDIAADADAYTLGNDEMASCLRCSAHFGAGTDLTVVYI